MHSSFSSSWHGFLFFLTRCLCQKLDNIVSMIRRRFPSTGMDPAMAQPHNDQGSFDEDFLDYIPEELIKQPINSFNCLSSCVAAAEACMQFSAGLPIGGSAIPCSDCNSNCNDITNITNIFSIENTGIVDGSTIVVGAMSLGWNEWCRWSDCGYPMCAILFKVSSICHNKSKSNRTNCLLMSDLKHTKS